MKYAMFILISLFAGLFASGSDTNYDKLWKEVEAQERSLPKSAYDLVKDIYKLAQKEGRDDQLVKAILVGYRLRSQFEDEDPATYILEAETELEQLQSTSGKAIYSSILGQLYHSYGSSNQYRFQKRSEVEGQAEKRLAFESLDQIQRKAVYYFKQSLEYKLDEDLEALEILVTYQNNPNYIKAKTLEQVLYFNALAHFIDSRSLVSLPTEALTLNKEVLFKEGYTEMQAPLSALGDNQYHEIALTIFAEAQNLKSLSIDQKIALEIYRLGFLKNNSTIGNKESLYKGALLSLARKYNTSEGLLGYEAAYCKLISEKINEGLRHKRDLDPFSNEAGSMQIAGNFLEELKDSKPDKSYNEIIKNLEAKIKEVELEIKVEKVVVPEEPFLANVIFRNTPEIIIEIYSTEGEAYWEFLNKQHDKKVVKIARQNTLVRTQSIEIPFSSYAFGTFTSIEVAIEALPVGKYIMLVTTPDKADSNSRDGYAVTTFHVSNLSYLHMPGSPELDGYVVDRTTGTPISQAEVTAQAMSYNNRSRKSEWSTVSETSTDTNGYFLVKSSERNISYKIAHNGDVLDLRESHYNRQRHDRRGSTQVQIFTDRAIYRPGQTIYYKGLVTEVDKDNYPSIAANQTVKITFRDANWQVVSEESYETNAYGTFNGVLTAPTGALTGSMVIEARAGRNTYQQQVQVEEYKRPKIYAEINKLDKSYVLGDTITVSGQVKAYSGSQIANAKVRYRIERQENRWWGFYRYGGSNRPAEQLAIGETMTNTNGSFSVTFPSKVSVQNRAGFQYTIHCDIVDATGETTTISKSIPLTKQPFRLVIDLPENSFVDEQDTFSIKALNVENQEIEVTYDLIIDALEIPETLAPQKYWDNYKSGASPYDNWKYKEQVVKLKQVKASECIEAISALGEGAFRIVFQANDADGNELNRTRYRFITAKHKKALPTKHLWLSKIQNTYQPGETFNLTVSTPYDKSQVLYQVSSAEKELKEDWLQLSPSGTIEWPITEAQRGGFSITLAMIKHNRVYTEKVDINVPWTNKQLKIEYATFRDKLEPGTQEKWILKIMDLEGQAVDGELAAALYDASLDYFKMHDWVRQFYPNLWTYQHWQGAGFMTHNGHLFKGRQVNYSYDIYGFDGRWNLFGYGPHSHIRLRGRRSGGREMMAKSAMGAPMPSAMQDESEAVMVDAASNGFADADANASDVANDIEKSSSSTANSFSLRENLKETVFFYPELEINKGETEISFTMNEALTKWKLLLFGHTQSLQYVFDTKEILTQKSLMIEPNLPRFIRQGDVINLNAKVTNLSDKAITAETQLALADAITDEDLSRYIEQTIAQSVTLQPGESTVVEWLVSLPLTQLNPLVIKMTAEGSGYADGEQNSLPVLSNRMLVTETMPMHVSGGETAIFNFNALSKMEESESLESHNLSLEFTTNPAWIVAKAMPYLTAGDKPTTTSLFNSIYGNLMMRDLLQKNANIKKAIELWTPEDLKSNLSKNQDLKLNSLAETPWVRAALGEEKQMAQLKLYLDDNYVMQQINQYTAQLKQRQLSNGGFTWMPGGRDNWYLTQNILEGLGQLHKLGIETGLSAMTSAAVKYVDERLVEHYDKHESKSAKYLSPLVIHYLYVRSLYKSIPYQGKTEKVVKHYLSKGEKYWPDVNSYQQALLGMAMHRMGKSMTAEKIVASLQERMITSKELGNYWNDQAGYYWYNLNIEKQAAMIELYQEMKQPQADIDGMKLWLLKTKQTNSWKTTKGTAAACYAFLLDNTDLKLGKAPTTSVDVIFQKSGEAVAFSQGERVTGYARKDWGKADISLDQKSIQVTNPNDHVVWGAAYYQYFEDMEKIEGYEDTPTKLTKEVYLVGTDDNGEILRPVSADSPIQPGDRLRIKINLQVDRPMEYMEMKDMRSSGLEPINVLSRSKYQDGLSYYESTKDVATYFYFDRLPKGNFVFEYDVFAVHQGTFSNGITQIQSMYAPEFSSHSAGTQLSVTKP